MNSNYRIWWLVLSLRHKPSSTFDISFSQKAGCIWGLWLGEGEEGWKDWKGDSTPLSVIHFYRRAMKKYKKNSLFSHWTINSNLLWVSKNHMQRDFKNYSYNNNIGQHWQLLGCFQRKLSDKTFELQTSSKEEENIARVQNCPDIKMWNSLFVFLSFRHSNQMSGGSQISNVTLCVEVLKWQWLPKVRYIAAKNYILLFQLSVSLPALTKDWVEERVEDLVFLL